MLNCDDHYSYKPPWVIHIVYIISDNDKIMVIADRCFGVTRLFYLIKRVFIIDDSLYAVTKETDYPP